MFDNGSRPFGTTTRSYSRVVGVDPARDEVVWVWKANPRRELFVPSRGASQPLPNGNILITDTQRGRVFEITREGDVVWDYWHARRLPDGRRQTIYRMYRMSDAAFAELRRAGQTRQEMPARADPEASTSPGPPTPSGPERLSRPNASGACEELRG